MSVRALSSAQTRASVTTDLTAYRASHPPGIVRRLVGVPVVDGITRDSKLCSKKHPRGL